LIPDALVGKEHIHIMTHFFVTALALNFLFIEVLDVCKETFNVINLVARTTLNVRSARIFCPLTRASRTQ
jgi:hypothetical protein